MMLVIPFAEMSLEARNPWQADARPVMTMLTGCWLADWWKIHEPGKIENAEGNMCCIGAYESRQSRSDTTRRGGRFQRIDKTKFVSFDFAMLLLVRCGGGDGNV